MENYVVFGRIGEGAHGVILKAKHTKSNELVALKKISLRNSADGIPTTALREIKALQFVESCPYVVRLREMFPHGFGFVLVFDYMTTDLSEIIRNHSCHLKPSHVKSYMMMLLLGLEVIHSLGIMHRDLKPANLLLNENGILKIADFGLARLYQDCNARLYSHQVATRWYRAPELLYGAQRYFNHVDLWAVGCIFAELLNLSPIFPGENDIEQLWIVIRSLGTPKEDDWPELVELPDYNKITFTPTQPVPFEEILPDAPPEALDLVKRFLVYPPSKRISASEALLHDYFTTEPLPTDFSELPRPQCMDHNLATRHLPQSYESCLQSPLTSLTVSHEELLLGSQLSPQKYCNALVKPEPYTPPANSPQQIAIPLSHVKHQEQL